MIVNLCVYTGRTMQEQYQLRVDEFEDWPELGFRWKSTSAFVCALQNALTLAGFMD
jgi:hypothetical protein